MIEDEDDESVILAAAVDVLCFLNDHLQQQQQEKRVTVDAEFLSSVDKLSDAATPAAVNQTALRQLQRC
jgi:hypothetical protein